jgi:hypothetical protein
MIQRKKAAKKFQRALTFFNKLDTDTAPARRIKGIFGLSGGDEARRWRVKSHPILVLLITICSTGNINLICYTGIPGLAVNY